MEKIKWYSLAINVHYCMLKITLGGYRVIPWNDLMTKKQLNKNKQQRHGWNINIAVMISVNHQPLYLYQKRKKASDFKDAWFFQVKLQYLLIH